MTKKQMAETKAQMIAAHEALLAVARTERTIEARDAVVRSSAALSAWIMVNDPPKLKRPSNRAGLRQQAEHRAVWARR